MPEPSRNIFYEWVSEYTDKAIYGTKDLKATTSGHWVADEIMVRVGGGWAYGWTIMDAGTRYILTTHLSRHRSKEETATAFLKARQAADKTPHTITTDQYVTYASTVKDLFPKVIHIESEGIHAAINNNLAERVIRTQRSREKTLMGMDSIQTGQRYLDGFNFNYNFLRKHWALNNKTPASEAKINSPFKEWADVVRTAIDVPQQIRTKARPRSEREDVVDNLRKGRRKRQPKKPTADMKVIRNKEKDGKQLPLITARMLPKPPKPKPLETVGRQGRKTRKPLR